MADLTTVSTQGYFGSVTDRIVAIATQGHFDELSAESQLLRFTLDIKSYTNPIVIVSEQDIGDIQVSRSKGIKIDS